MTNYNNSTQKEVNTMIVKELVNISGTFRQLVSNLENGSKNGVQKNTPPLVVKSNNNSTYKSLTKQSLIKSVKQINTTTIVSTTKRFRIIEKPTVRMLTKQMVKINNSNFSIIKTYSEQNASATSTVLPTFKSNISNSSNAFKSFDFLATSKVYPDTNYNYPALQKELNYLKTLNSTNFIATLIMFGIILILILVGLFLVLKKRKIANQNELNESFTTANG
jgi:hypothetical protein